MSVSLYLTNITHAISQLSISGVTIRDYDEVVSSWISSPKVLYPNIDNFVTASSISFPTFVQDGSGPVDIKYTLNYRYLSTQVGESTSTVPVQYANVLSEAIAIANALIVVRAPYSGRVLMTMDGLPDVGPKLDPVGNQYFGADIKLTVQELQN